MGKSTTTYSILVLLLFHVIGAAGMIFYSESDFALLTPLNLLLILGIILFNERTKLNALAFVVMYSAGLLVEIIGVNTGIPFGQYEYGAVLGPQIFATPLIIGVNWFILLFATNAIAGELLTPKTKGFVKAAFAAALMVILDFVIEPVAIDLSFWTWESVDPPLENYFSWFAISFLLSIVWQRRFKILVPKLGIAIYLIQLAFFLTLKFSL